MAKAGLNYLRGNPDPQRNYECRFSLYPLSIPVCVPYVKSNKYGFDPISLGDTDSRMDWQYPHMREIVGEPAADPVELGVRRRILSYQRADGACYINPAAYVGEPVEGEWAGTWTTAKLLYSLSETYLRTKDEALREPSRKTFLALKNLALWDGPRAYYPGIAPFRNGQWLRSGWCSFLSRNYPFIVEPCVRYYECLGDREALDFARAVTEGMLAGSQKDQREFAVDPQTGAYQGHVHIHLHAYWGAAHLGAILNEPRYLDWARKACDYTYAKSTDYGWVVEALPQNTHYSETCAVGDMVSASVWLARAGWPQYWDRVDRAVRNYLRRAQFFVTPAFEKHFRALHTNEPAAAVNQALTELKKLEGGFAARCELDDLIYLQNDPKAFNMMGCCQPEGLRAVWEAWNGIVEERPEGIFVNLAMTREHPAARVSACRPADGQIEVQARKPGNFFLRPPAWADKEQVALLRNGKQQKLEWGGPEKAYVVGRDLRPGQTLTLSWPVPAFRQVFTPQSVPDYKGQLTVDWVGNEVQRVEPRGKYLPMFGNEGDPLQAWLKRTAAAP
jgi:hypothetical protein